MWFHKDLNEIYQNGFQPALEATGYRPFHIDMREHNGKIDDLIIAEIRKSGLLVAGATDVSDGEPDLYFEAGISL